MILALMLLAASAASAESAIDVIMNTGTTQAFTDEAVPAADVETILRAGLAAASAINQQPWFFVAVTNPEILKEIGGSGAGFAPPAGAGSKPEGAPEGFPGGAPDGAPAGEMPPRPRPAEAVRKPRWATLPLPLSFTKTAVPNPPTPTLTAALPSRTW